MGSPVRGDPILAWPPTPLGGHFFGRHAFTDQGHAISFRSRFLAGHVCGIGRLPYKGSRNREGERGTWPKSFASTNWAVRKS